jgi:hypothetical protein
MEWGNLHVKFLSSCFSFQKTFCFISLLVGSEHEKGRFCFWSRCEEKVVLVRVGSGYGMGWGIERETELAEVISFFDWGKEEKYPE